MALDREKVEGYMAKSKANLAEAEACLSQKLIRAAINRAYYALYQAANAWIELKGYRQPRLRNDEFEGWSHSQVAKVWVRILEDLSMEGISTEAGALEIFDQVYHLRVMADYRARIEPKDREAEQALGQVRRALGYLYNGIERL